MGERAAGWLGSGEIRVAEVLPGAACHTIHTYFNTSPESPDGRWVLLFASTDSRGEQGDVQIVERATGAVRVLARGVVTEDAHRVAVQQWVCGGRRVVFHDLRGGEWVVVAVDIETLEERVYAPGRQVGFGHPSGNVVPLYGPHWDPGEHRDLEILDVTTGEIRKVLTWERVRERYPEWVARLFGDRPISIFFPILSPDLTRVIFKVATPGTGIFQTKGDSFREGLLCYDLVREEFCWMQEAWHHPAWSADGSAVINVGPTLTDARTGEGRPLPPFPKYYGSHPSLGPDGRTFVTDAKLERNSDTRWAVIVGDLKTGAYETVHTFDNSQGAQTWRRNHPHPVFSLDGRRLYFNVSADRWTRLHVAELPRHDS